ncbi:MAG: metalloregulator ArsR/SmtB family transcription factor [Dehalococcoidia bacterium]|jgi:ArsR family transcriptional regulator|nr:ArsR family transcriptional regulator [Chloroflexota bacterium]MDP5876578.1 metalloregulator ArsR/SmtB family transcription factor [Dehalococcoidia bacterium]MDP6273084.1 metalloregulator ArsR/SmtB family transcription factor [Dehalococcoidia bacterium]MDP7161265.1 metalloregulator ArsR/SmtB family transcription factor [Dehalococcoidia bacterium]MDP7213162.1 metalloregulator ArsR/SmtB family transcription factor [Dehalococcoidia bacterium]|tara:strand:- start:3 stop:980 length:978 start_codon:yes stop_codon:yes gene_type:complete
MDQLLAGLRAAGEPTRLRLLALCARSELTVTELTQILRQSQPRVSRHLKLLVEAGLLGRFREGQWAFYRIANGPESPRLGRAIVDLIPSRDPVYVRDLERLEEIKEARAEAAASYFSNNAPQWDQMRSMYVPEEEVEACVRDLLSSAHPSDLLDIGTGTGRILEVMAPDIQNGVGIDLSHEMLAVARVNLGKAGLEHCQVRHGDMYELPFDDASQDAVVFHQVLHYAEEPASAITEAARVLRPGGPLLVIDFAPHEQRILIEEHAHHRLGLAEEEVAAWCESAGLRSELARELKGEPLTVNVWLASHISLPLSSAGSEIAPVPDS